MAKSSSVEKIETVVDVMPGIYCDDEAEIKAKKMLIAGFKRAAHLDIILRRVDILRWTGGRFV